MNILTAIRDEALFKPFLCDAGGDLDSWRRWAVALKALYGMPIKSRWGKALIAKHTGRDPALLPAEGFDEALFLIGRRSGKSRIVSVCGAFESLFGGYEKKLAPGETGLVLVTAPSKAQAGIVLRYIRAIFHSPMLEREVVREDRDGFELRNGITIMVLAGDFRTIRGFTLVSAITDETAFFGLSEENKIRSDTELIRSIRPGLATAGGRLLSISSPYSLKGYTYRTSKKNFGNDKGSILVWNADSRTMNPTLRESVVTKAFQEDPQAARSEFGRNGHVSFREDVASFLPRDVVEHCVAKGRVELMPRSSKRYVAFCDVSGGRNDAAALCIAHREEPVNGAEGKIVIDCLRHFPAPHNPNEVIRDMAETCKTYRVNKVTGDAYGADFVKTSFEACRIAYERSEKNKSALYLELLPILCSKGIELLDDERLVNQIAGLERRTRSGGKDTVDHPSGQHDDAANAVAGCATVASKKRIRVGAF